VKALNKRNGCGPARNRLMAKSVSKLPWRQRWTMPACRDCCHFHYDWTARRRCYVRRTLMGASSIDGFCHVASCSSAVKLYCHPRYQEEQIGERLPSSLSFCLLAVHCLAPPFRYYAKRRVRRPIQVLTGTDITASFTGELASNDSCCSRLTSSWV
jgi:hypothetical protein